MIALYLIAAHMLGDYILQTQWQADNKLKDQRVLLLHVFLYTLAFIPVTILAGLNYPQANTFLGLVFLGHLVVDCRRWVRADHPWPLKGLFVDQTLHMIHLTILGAAFGL